MANYPHYRKAIERRLNEFSEDDLPNLEGYCEWLGESCITLSIRSGQLYVQHMEKGYQSRFMAVLHLYYRMWLKFGEILPDADLVFDINDGPKHFFKSHAKHNGVYAF